MNFRLLPIMVLALLLNACALFTQISHHPEQYQISESRSCANLFIHTDQVITKAGVVDAGASRIPGYPYIRVNRFLSSYRNEEMDHDSFNSWVNHMQNLAMEGWRVELGNLPAPEREKLTLQANDIALPNMSLNETLNYCGNILRAVDLDKKSKREDLKSKAVVPDEYNSWQRVIGLYPVTALAFRTGIDRWHAKTSDLYARPLSDLTVSGRLIRYSPSTNNVQLSPLEVSRIIENSSHNALKIPVTSAHDRRMLFDNFAPVYEVDTVNNDDRIGTAELDKDNVPQVNTDKVKIYHHLSYARVKDHVLLQLNYTVWFPSRPKTSSFDILGGHLDGLTWRVTVLPDVNPCLFDSIHNFRCYHLFFPTQFATVLPHKQSLDEPAFIPQLLSIRSFDRPIIRIAHRTHYIDRVYYGDYSGSKNMINYQLSDSNELRSVESGDGKHHSLFGQDGIIHSSKRGERFLFWPMGIPNPGAMRQWGHHATAFVGRRHFDDARLFENYLGFIDDDNQ